MAYDFKKELKHLYLPPATPTIIEVPPMNYIAVEGKGNPNDENGPYSESVELLYAIAYTIKMSYKSDYRMEGFFQYVVPPLEGFWWQEGIMGFDPTQKDALHFTSIIRLPDFVTEEDFRWAVERATLKKKKDFSKVFFLPLEEGLTVQCLHVGPYDDEPRTVSLMDDYVKSLGFTLDFSEKRKHHEIYLSDPRKTAPDKLKTVLRHPIR